jgi:hypothetical protein
MLLVQIGCEGTYWLVCIDTQIPQLLKGGTIWWGVNHDDLFWFCTNHHNQRIVILIISKILKNQQSGESTQKQEPNNTSLNQCYMGIRICYRYLLIITWVYTHWGEKGSKIGFWYRTLVLSFFEIKKKTFLTVGSLPVLSWKLLVLWCIRLTQTDSSLILIFFSTTNPLFFDSEI